MTRHRSLVPLVSDFLQTSRQVPLLAACSVPFSAAQVAMLTEMEKASRPWFERRRQAARATCEFGQALAACGYCDPIAAVRAMAHWSGDASERLYADLREGSMLSVRCWTLMAGSMTSAGIAGAEVAEKAAPVPGEQHSMPI